MLQKGIDWLIGAFGVARRQGLRWQLVIAGAPWRDSERRIARLIARSGVGGAVSHVGSVDEHAKWWLLRNALCLVFPSRWDGPPRPIREALSVGTPVIV